MNRKEFQKVLQRYIAGTSTDEEKNLVDQWYQLLEDESVPELSLDELNAIKYRTLSAIKHSSTPSEMQAGRPPVSTYRKWRWLAAAVAAGVIIFSTYFWKAGQDGVKEPYASSGLTNVIEKLNTSQQPLKIMLDDSSMVTLQPGSGLKYPAHFDSGKREVYMQGEVFFEVSKNAAKPFYVYNNSIITHVLGTSFNIRTDRKNNTIQVNVHTGKVEVLENRGVLGKKAGDKINRIILNPNQKATYHEGSGQFEASLADKPVLLKSNSRNIQDTKIFIFDEAPLSMVLKTLEQQYGIEMIAEADELLKEPFTGDISRNDMFAKLDIVCKSLKICYEVNGTKILIRSNGCD